MGEMVTKEIDDCVWFERCEPNDHGLDFLVHDRVGTADDRAVLYARHLSQARLKLERRDHFAATSDKLLDPPVIIEVVVFVVGTAVNAV